MCTQFQSKLKGMRNYNPAYIEGSNNLRASSFKDHAASDMHSRAMLMLKRAQSTDILEYAPIAKALHTMDAPAEQELKRKFDIAFMIAKEHMAFTKIKPICDLEERHGVSLGQSYKNNQACATFVEYIALERRKIYVEVLGRAKFFSIQADSSTDAGNAEEELFLVVYLDHNAMDKRVHIRNPFFMVRKLQQGNAEGLLACLESAMVHVGVDSNWRQ